MGTKQNNFKTALNELMAGKLSTDEEDAINESGIGTESSASASEPFFRKPAINSSYSSAPTPTSILSHDLIIDGNISSKSNIRIEGRIKGNINCTGNISCTGTVDGDIQCDSITMNGCSITGNVSVKNDINIDADALVIGDIKTLNINCNGKVKGNVSATGAAILKEKAQLLGNLTARTISLETGAALKGTLDVQSSNLSEDDFKPKSVKTPAQPAPDKPKASTFTADEADSKKE